MKSKLSKALVLLLTVAILAAQLMVPAYAVEPFECTCDMNARTGTVIDTVGATCDYYGYDVYVCDDCGGQYSVATAVPLGHAYSAAAEIPGSRVDSTCSVAGSYKTSSVCANCGDEIITTVDLDLLAHDFSITVANKGNTCTEDGWTKHKECSVCGAKDASYTVRPKKGHLLKNTIKVDPTCTEDGYEAKGCSRTGCGYIEVTKTIPTEGHTNGTPVQENVIGATCTAEGTYDEVVYCSVCGLELSRVSKTIGVLGHEAGSVVKENEVAETCTTDGSYDEVTYCTRCGLELSRKTVSVKAHGHNYQVIFTQDKAHCQDTTGYKTYECTICHDSYDEPIAPADHKYEIIDITGETCTNPGTVTYKCTVCGMELVETVAEELPHTEGDVVVENKVDPDCYTDGSYDNVVYCTVCNTELSRKTEVVKSEGHNLTDVPKLDATCTDDGYEAHKLCTICGYETPFAVLPATGHDYKQTVIAATCTKQGYTVNTCSVCGDTYNDAYTAINPLNHTTYISKFSVAATCTETGLTHEIGCKECNAVIKAQETTAINSTNHNVVSVVTDPTCTEDGYTTHSCSRGCAYFTTYTDTIVPALGHRMENVVALAATCTTPGYTAHQECNRCGFETPYFTIDALGHDYDSVVTLPTCTEDGYTTHKCNTCGDVVVDTVVSELGHVTTITIGTVDPTCTEIGYTIEQCTVCSATFRDNFVDELGHTESDFIIENKVDPTCTTEGKYDSVVYCEVCVDETTGLPTELSRKTTIVDALGHTKAAATQENRVEATCTVDGHYDSVVYCSVCGDELSRETMTLTAPGHTDGAVVVENYVDSTCTAEGSYDDVVYCSVCGDELSRDTKTIAMKPHTAAAAVRENVVDSTCTAEGSYDEVVYCSVCSTELSRETKTIAMKSHTPAAAVQENVVDSTCTAEGSYDEVVKCSVCSTELSRETKTIAMKSHTAAAAVKENEVAPTCTVDGSYDDVVYCSVCSTELSRNKVVVPATGHTDGPEVIENKVDPTYDADGSYDVVVYCSVCNVELRRNTVIVPILNEKVTFSYEAVGINGADVAVNSGKITLNVYMNVESDIARLYGIDLGLKFNSGLSLDEVVVSADGFEAAAYGLSGVGIKLTQDMAASGDKTFNQGKHLIATLTFDVADTFYNADASFEIVTEECEYARGMDKTYNNTIEVAFGTGTVASIFVDKLGDFNDDGKYTVNDTMALSKWLDTSVEYSAVLDMDKDGSITANDLALIREAVAGI